MESQVFKITENLDKMNSNKLNEDLSFLLDIPIKISNKFILIGIYRDKIDELIMSKDKTIDIYPVDVPYAPMQYIVASISSSFIDTIKANRDCCRAIPALVVNDSYGYHHVLIKPDMFSIHAYNNQQLNIYISEHELTEIKRRKMSEGSVYITVTVPRWRSILEELRCVLQESKKQGSWCINACPSVIEFTSGNLL